MRTEPILDYIEGREQDARTERALIARRLTAVEAALVAAGIAIDSLPGRILRLVVRVAGLGILHRTRETIASDSSVNCTAGSVPRAIKALETAGLLRRGIAITRGQPRGIALQVNWSAVTAAESAATAETSSPEVVWIDCATVTDTVTVTVTDTVAHTVAHTVTGTVAQSKHTVYPSYPNSHNPPPPGNAAHETESAAEFDLESWSAVADRLRGLGVERVTSTITAARRRGELPASVLRACDTFTSHRSRFDSVAALVDRIKTGDWCVAIPSDEQIASQAAAKRARRDVAERHRTWNRVYAERRRLGLPLTDAEIDAEVARILGDA